MHRLPAGQDATCRICLVEECLATAVYGDELKRTCGHVHVLALELTYRSGARLSARTNLQKWCTS